MLGGCHKCKGVTAFLFLVAGFLFLLVDVGVWSFWNLQWWTLLFVILGVTGLAKCCCKDCCQMPSMKSSKK